MERLLDQAAERLKRLPFFSTADYGLLNADLARSGVDLAHHALLYGCAEKRRIFRPDRLARAWGEALGRAPTAITADAPTATDLPVSAAVYVSSWSAPVFKDLAACLVRDLVSRGIAAELRTERAVPADTVEPSIIMAPHEFFRLGFGPAWRGTALAHSSLMLNTTAPASEEFATALPYLMVCRGVLDLSPQIVDVFSRAGTPACQIRPSFPPRDHWLEIADAEHPLVHALPAAARHRDLHSGEARPIDVSFLGSYTAWRGACLARMAPELARYRTFFHLRESAAERIDRNVLDRAQFRIAGHVASRSKLVLQITETEVPFFDWHSALQAMAAGAVLVTNHAAPHPEFVVGTHLFQADSRHLPDLIAWLVDDSDGQAAAETARSATLAILSDLHRGEGWVDRVASLWGSP